MSESMYTALLVEFGFDRWEKEDFEDVPEWNQNRVSGPCFWMVSLGRQIITFAFDECGDFWAVEREVDLTDLGFVDLFAKERKRPLLH